MEDLHTLKNNFAYQIRLDLSHNNISESLIDSWISNFNVSGYIFGREFKNNSIPHYQGIVWFENKLSQKQMCTCRNWFRGKTLKSAGNGHSFTSARKVTNLSKYCLKDGNYYTSLSSRQVNSIGHWDTKNALKLQKSEKLAKMVKIYIPTPINFIQFLSKFDKLYWEIYDNNPTRNMVLKYARKTQCMSRSRYYQLIGLLTEDNNIDYIEDEIINYGPEQIQNEKHSKDTIQAWI